MRTIIYTKTILLDDGTVAVSDATSEFNALKRKASKSRHDDPTMDISEVANIFKKEEKTIRNWMTNGKLLEGKHYSRTSSRSVVFYRKAIYEKLGLED